MLLFSSAILTTLLSTGVQKMEKERMEKLKKKAEQEKAEKEKSDKVELVFQYFIYFLCI